MGGLRTTGGFGGPKNPTVWVLKTLWVRCRSSKPERSLRAMQHDLGAQTPEAMSPYTNLKEKDSYIV